MKVTFEEVIDRAGFGLYSYVLTGLAGFLIISSGVISYGGTIIVPTSACELSTTASQQGLLVAAPILGYTLGGLIWGYLADTRGRRSMLMVALLGGAAVNMLASISVNWLMLMVLQFIATLFVSGVHSTAVTLVSESVPMAKRDLVVLLVSSISMLAQCIMAIIAIPIIPLTFSYYLSALGIYWNSWRTFMMILTLPSLISVVWLFYMQESPKFVFGMGDDEQALNILKIIHRMNKPGSGELKVDDLIKEESQHKPGTSSSPKDQIIPLFKSPLLKYTLIMTILFTFSQIESFMVWLPRIAHQYVTIIQKGERTNQTLCGIIRSSLNNTLEPASTPCSLHTTSLLLILGVGVSMSLVNLLVTLAVDKLGRRNLVIVLTSVCGVSGILLNSVPNAFGSAVLFGVMLQGLLGNGLYTAIVVAIFPTNLRAMAVTIPNTSHKITSFASIQILNLLLKNNCDIGFYLFSTLFVSSAMVASFLPDDRQALIPQPRKQEVEVKDVHHNESCIAY